jgi:hypothetical protein
MLASIRSRCPWLPAALLLAAAVAVLPAAEAGVPSPAMTYKAKTSKIKNADWCAQWWQWAYNVPEAQSPLYDETGALGGVGQRGPVWFLCGAYNDTGVSSRTVIVPEGVYLFFPILAAQLDNADPAFDPLTEDELRASVAAFVAGVNVESLTCTVDGVGITDLAKRRVISSVFRYVAVPGSTPNVLYNAAAGDVVSPSVSDGYWVMLKPLPIGNHTITWSGSAGENTQSVTYLVKVQAAAN